MKRLEYRCDKCLIIEEKWYVNSHQPSNSVLCHLCGGPALRIPLSTATDCHFEDGKRNRDGL